MTGLKQNQHPLEHLCEKKLREAKQQPDHDCLYSLQLMNWFLENWELEGPWKDDREDLLRHGQKMLGWNPDLVQKLLFLETEDEITLNPDELKDESPDTLGFYLAENLQQMFENQNPSV